MIQRRILAAVALLCLAAPAYGQSTKAQLNTQITTDFPNNTTGAITPTKLRSVTSAIVNSIMPTAPVVSGNLACFNGTTGLLQDCGFAPGLVVGSTSISGGTSTGILYNNAGVLGNSSIIQAATETGYPFLFLGDNYANAISRWPGDHKPLLFIDQSVNWDQINYNTVVDFSVLTAQSSTSNQYASFNCKPTTANTAFDWNHVVCAEDQMVYEGSGTLTYQSSFLSFPTYNGPVTQRSGIWLLDGQGTGTVGTQYGFRCNNLVKAAVNWCFYADGTTPSYLGGPVTMGSSLQVGATDLLPAVTKKIQVSTDGLPVAEVVAGQDSTHNAQLFWVYNATPASASGGIATSGYTNPFNIDASAVSINVTSNGNTTINKPIFNTLPTGSGVATANTASTLVARDASGNFSAGAITATSLVAPIVRSAASLQFQTNGTTFAGNVNASQQWLLGTTSVTPPTGPQLVVSKNTAAPASAPNVNALIYGYNADGVSSNIGLDGYGTGASAGLIMRAARGTAATPTQTQSGDNLFSFNAYAYNSTGGFAGGTAFGQGLLTMTSTENCSAAACGTKWAFYSVTTGTNTTTQKAQIGAGLSVGTTTDPGAGLINTNSATFMIGSKTSYNNGAGAGAGTLANAPSAGNPTKWIPVDDNGTTRYIPAW